MLEELLGALVRSQVGNLKRRTGGVILEGAALGMIGLATVFLSIAFYVFLSQHMQAWLAALILAVVASLVAMVLALIGRSLVRRKELHQHAQMLSGLEKLGLLSSDSAKGKSDGNEERETGPGLVAAALTAGVILGRSMRR
jgi:hypothetical protein